MRNTWRYSYNVLFGSKVFQNVFRCICSTLSNSLDSFIVILLPTLDGCKDTHELWSVRKTRICFCCTWIEWVGQLVKTYDLELELWGVQNYIDRSPWDQGEVVSIGLTFFVFRKQFQLLHSQYYPRQSTYSIFTNISLWMQYPPGN